MSIGSLFSMDYKPHMIWLMYFMCMQNTKSHVMLNARVIVQTSLIIYLCNKDVLVLCYV